MRLQHPAFTAARVEERLTARAPLTLPSKRLAGLGEGEVMTSTVIAVVALAVVGTTVASYYLVKNVAPKKSAKAYGAGAAASNLLVPIVGPVIVGLIAAGDKGKR